MPREFIGKTNVNLKANDHNKEGKMYLLFRLICINILIIFYFSRNLLRLLQFNRDGGIYLFNMTLLAITYFMVRILPLPIILFLYGSKSGSIVEGSIYQSMSCVIRTFTLIPIQCKLGCMVFYSMQIYWFFNIIRNWIRVVTKQLIYSIGLCRGQEKKSLHQKLKVEGMHEKGKKML